MVFNAGVSSNATNWLVQPVTMVTVSWMNHFENTRHIGSGWLGAVADYPGIERTSKYDDIFWSRTVDAITHINGKVTLYVRYSMCAYFEILNFEKTSKYYSCRGYPYSKARILRTRIIRIHAYNEVISIPRQKPFKKIRKN